ncbi:phosphotransferase [Parahaliea aestuarii]|uniref:phosphotransferase n=1 Tax=Parahaliea aestuarii TaxID=1852021 RepID=UPI00164FE927|nr:phosphotransferase [Parahaliea aestuarii]
MVTPLPRDRQLRLARVLSQWRHWDCDPPLPAEPTVAAELGPGFSNSSYKVSSADGRLFTIRLDGVDPAHHGISRQAEWRALHSAHRAGIAPRPRYFNPDLGALVYDYLALDAEREHNTADVARLLRSIHALPPLHHRLDLGERTTRYRRHCTPGHRLAQALAAIDHTIDEVLAWQRGQNNLCLCHNDLLAANRIVSGGRLQALDWEYCAMGSPWFDLAVVCAGDELGRAGCEELLANYLLRQPAQRDWQQLATYALLYHHIEVLWFADTSPEGVDLAAKVDQLLAAAGQVQTLGLPQG